MKDLIAFIATHLVDEPDAVDTLEREEDGTVTVELRVAKEDLGKVIGKQGRTARAMRAVLAAVSAKEDKRSRLEILE
ncbi:MAG: RNA-binding protein [Desulfobulbus sp.]|nr:MAG: RNA-binding protein [Desulfobulbus sp.]RUM37420.1 MAG: RNA-binding protein [Desulfobulbus sp.]RUM41028.1 MAG: RNA-binding protein [Desulfobulbus sp.]